MKSGNTSLVIDNELLEQYDYEGMLIPPTMPHQAMLVLSSKNDSFTLHIYKLQLQTETEYHVVKKLTTKTFKSLVGMTYFINNFSNYREHEFMAFIKQHDKEI